MPIYYGVDVSQFQGTINWASVKSVRDFGIIKASGGDAGLYVDSKFTTNAFNARSVGIKRGFYHFGSLGLNNATTEADFFTAAVGTPQPGEILVLDAESEAGAGIVLNQSSVAWCKTFLDRVAATVGFKPFIYMSQYPSYSIDWSVVASAGYPLWVANYGVAPTGNNMYVGAWSDLGKGFPIHQYSSSGSVSGIGGAVDVDAFFVPAGGTLDSWDGYGAGGSNTGTSGSGTPIIQAGVNTTATGSTNSSYSQSYDITLNTNDTHDQVIYSVITTDAVLATGSHNAFYEIPTNIGQTAYPIGTFSYDGGVTFNDFGVILPIVTTYATVQPGVTIQPTVDASGNIFFNGVNNTGASVNLILQIALLASYAPTFIPTPPKLANSTSYTNDAKPIPSPTFQAQYLPPYASYRRVAKDSVSGTGDVDVAHGQPDVPNIMFWVNIGGVTTIDAVGWASNGAIGDLGIYMDSTNVHFHVNGAVYNNAYYRIYKDN